MAVSRIIRELDAAVVLFGGATEKDNAMVKTIFEFVEHQNSSLDGLHSAVTAANSDPGGNMDWPLRRSLTQIKQCDVVVSPDTGAAWAAAFEPMPKVVMVSHASVENITKHWVNTVTLHASQNRVACWPCHRLHNDTSTCVPSKDGNSSACMADIPVDLIFNAVKSALDGGSCDDLVSRWSENVI